MLEDRLHFGGKGYDIPSQIISYDDDDVITYDDNIDTKSNEYLRERKRNKKRKKKRSH